MLFLLPEAQNFALNAAQELSVIKSRPVLARSRAIAAAGQARAFALVSLLTVIGLALCAGAGWLRVT